MNKKLIAAAIAAAVAAPTAALANDVTIYGVVHASIDYRTDGWDSRAQPWIGRDAVDGYWGSGLSGGDNGAIDGFDVASRATRIGFKGTEDLANGLKAIWKIEVQADIADLGGSCAGPGLFAGVPYGSNSPTINNGGSGAGPNAWAIRAGYRFYDNGGSATSGLNAAGGTPPQCATTDWWSARNAYIGLAGGWGTFLVGRHDTPYKMTSQKLDLFADTLADWNSTIGFSDIRINSAIAYVSPSFAGFSFAGALVAPHTYYEVGGDTFDADGLAEAWSVAATYDANGFFATVAYENIGSDWITSWAGPALYGQPAFSGTSNSGWDAIALSNGIDDSEKLRVGLGWTGMGFTVGGVYEWEDNVLGYEANTDAERWQLSAGYTFGNTMVKVMYGQSDFTGPWALYDDTVGIPVVGAINRDRLTGDSSAWAIGLDHNLSKRTKAYLLYTNVDYSWDYQADENRPDDNDGAGTGWYNHARGKLDGDAGGWSLGLIHNF